MDNMMVQKIEDIKQNPGDYFNFGLNFEDFKHYLLKITYCRAARMFID